MDAFLFRRGFEIYTFGSISNQSMDLNAALRNPRIVLGSIIALVLVLYGQSLSYKEQVLDDAVVLENPYVKEGLSATGKIFSSGFLKGFNGISVSYRPLSTFTFALEQSLHNGNPFLRRLFNLLLYASCGFLLWLLSKSWFPKQKDWFHAMLVLLFIAHPIHTEVVSNLKSRDEILTLLFLLASLYSIDHYLKSKKNLMLGLGACFFFLSLLCKENAVTFIVIIPLTLYVFYNLPIKQLSTIILPFLAPLGAYFLLRIMILDDVGETGVTQIINNAMVEAGTLPDRLASSSHLLLLYFQKLLVPIKLNWDYSYPIITYVPFSSVKGILSTLAVIGATVYSLYLLYRKNTLGWVILCIMISLVLVLNFFILIGATFAERFLFTPSLFFVIGLTWLFALGLNKPKSENFIKGIVGVLLLFYCYQTFTRNKDWESSETLFMASLKTHPEGSRVQASVGTLYREKAEAMPPSRPQENIYTKALKHYGLATKACDQNFEAWFNIGVIYQSTGRIDLAEQAHKKVLEIHPEYIGALNNLGFFAFNEKNFDKALDYFYKAAGIQPKNAQVLGNIGSSYHNLGKLDSARVYYERSLAINPDQPNVQANYSMLKNKMN